MKSSHISNVMTKIGFFDSGHGGLGILEASIKLLPNCEFYYIGDSAFHPYGEKSDDEIIERSRALTDILIEKECGVIVVACNSATAAAIDQLRLDYPKVAFVGVEPYLNILSKKEFLINDKIGVLVTKRTYNSARLKKLKERVDQSNRLEIEYVNDLATFVDRIITTKKSIDHSELKALLAHVLDKKWDYVILGCTHYPLIIKELESLLSAKCLDPAPYVAKQIREVLSARNSLVVKDTDRNDNLLDVPFYYMQTNENLWSQKRLNDFLWWH